MTHRSSLEPAGEVRRQIVSFSFYKVLPEWRRLQDAEKERHRREFAEVIERWRESEDMRILCYSLVGLRAECDLMLWRICYSLECLQQMQAELMSTRLGGYLTLPHSFLGMTRHSQYRIGHSESGATAKCGVSRYAFVYPYAKTRAWYQLPFEERQRIVGDLMKLTQDFPGLRLNTIYSFGLDDQEFVIVWEGDNPADLVDLMVRVREAENSLYVVRDVPSFSCVQTTPQNMLELVG